MYIDKDAKPWILGCLVVAMIVGILHYGTLYLFPCAERLCHSVLGLTTALCCFYCSSLWVVRKLPHNWKKKISRPIDNGHPWIGFLGCWTAVLHTRFKIPPLYFNWHSLTFYTFWAMVIFGLVFFYFHHFQVLKKDAKGTVKKEQAGHMISGAYDTSKVIHEGIHWLFYVCLFYHVLAYLIYGRFW